MEFWGVEVKAGQTLRVYPGDDKILHLSQASLGEVKKDKGNDSVPLFVNVGGQKLVLGTLSHEKCAQITFDLVFEKEFELSHNWKHGSVYFIGYKSVFPDESEDLSDFESDSEEEEIPLQATDNGKPVQKKAKPAMEKANAAKPDTSTAKPKVKIVEPEKSDKSKEEDDDEDDDEDEEDDSDEDESSDQDMLDAADGSEEDDDSSDDEHEDTPTPKKVEQGKKRLLESAAKTPASDKKAKLVTPQKTDGKKGGGHTATPHPNKAAAKTPASNDKSKGPQTPKSPGQFPCKSCNKSFSSDNGLQDHSKAKHSSGK